MEQLLELISDEVSKGFAAAGYRGELGKVTVSNRPDLCEFQCNGSMAGAKTYHCAPMKIAQNVVDILSGNPAFERIECCVPGFININISGKFLADYVERMAAAEKHGITLPEKKTIIIDYGGPNVAKPLHVGHLRSAIIGESIKRILLYGGHDVIGDIHLGDWGLQMGLIIEGLKERKPTLPYFDEDHKGGYPEEPPFTLAELEEIYPEASARSKNDKAFAALAHEATQKIQDGDPAYNALWKHIMNVSLPDLKENYRKLDVHFDLWKGESDAKPYIAQLVQSLKDKGLAYISDGALVVDVAMQTDTKEIPPCIILKSDGAALYQTTDLATIIEREKDYKPDRMIYLTDKRQEMHFTQVFRTAKKAGFVPEETELDFIGFGTMNGKDGKPFKTRSGGVMRLEYLISEINDAVYGKIQENRSISPEEAEDTAGAIGLAALKYGDLSNQASKDYVFDVERFTSFEGNTGPYILYTIVRIKSILRKYEDSGKSLEGLCFGEPLSASEKSLLLQAARFPEVYQSALAELAPHRLCAYIYDLSNEFNRFYHETKILAETDEAKQGQYIRLISYTKELLETCIDMLGFYAPERM